MPLQKLDETERCQSPSSDSLPRILCSKKHPQSRGQECEVSGLGPLCAHRLRPSDRLHSGLMEG